MLGDSGRKKRGSGAAPFSKVKNDYLGSGAGDPVGAGALGALSDGDGGAAEGAGLGGRGGRPDMMSFTCSASIVSHSINALVIASTLSRFSSISRRASEYCSSMILRISASTFCIVASDKLLCVVMERPRNTSPSFSPY